VRVEWVSDNLVWLSVLLAVVVIVAGIIAMVVTGLRMYRAVRASASAAGAAGASLSAEVERLTAAADALPQRSAELQREIAGLKARSAALSVVMGHAAELFSLLRTPLGTRFK
jgi:type II secretory pathway pseudopilin PulG